MLTKRTWDTQAGCVRLPGAPSGLRCVGSLAGLGEQKKGVILLLLAQTCQTLEAAQIASAF